MRIPFFVLVVCATNLDESSWQELSEAYAAAVQKAFAAPQGSKRARRDLDELQRLLALDSSLASAAISSKGATALHFAAKQGRVDVAEILLASGASISAEGAGIDTPLALACASVQLDVAAFLMANGAGPEPRCGAAALHLSMSLQK